MRRQRIWKWMQKCAGDIVTMIHRAEAWTQRRRLINVEILTCYGTDYAPVENPRRFLLPFLFSAKAMLLGTVCSAAAYGYFRRGTDGTAAWKPSAGTVNHCPGLSTSSLGLISMQGALASGISGGNSYWGICTVRREAE